MALHAFAVARRAAALLLLTAGRAAIDRFHLAAGRTAANPLQRRVNGTDGQTDGRTDTRQLYRPCSAHYAGSVNKSMSILHPQATALTLAAGAGVNIEVACWWPASRTILPYTFILFQFISF